MKLQNRLFLMSALLSTTGLLGCGDDTDYCVLTDESCEKIGATLDIETCKCVNQSACSMTQEMCESANKDLDAKNCMCVEKPTQQTCPMTQEMCESANKDLDAEKCTCVEKPTQQTCPITQEMCASSNKDLDAEKCTCVEKACNLTEKTCQAAGKTFDKSKCQCVAPPSTKWSVGDIVTFGHYEQDNVKSNGNEPITWRVLDIKGSQYLIISEKALDAKTYNTVYTSVTWEKSTIRSWLNGYGASYNTKGENFTTNNFINTAFTADEINKIVSSNVPAHKNPKHTTDPGQDTTDKIFMLSITEVKMYLPSNTDRLAVVTPYAQARGAEAYDHPAFHNSSNWWLRTPGLNNSFAASITDEGNVNSDGKFVSNTSIAIRPVLWVNL